MPADLGLRRSSLKASVYSSRSEVGSIKLVDPRRRGDPALSDATICDIVKCGLLPGSRSAPIGTFGRVNSDSDPMAWLKSAGARPSAPIHISGKKRALLHNSRPVRTTLYR